MKIFFYAAVVCAAVCAFFALRDFYRYWSLDAQTTCFIEDTVVRELSPSRFDILATYTFIVCDKSCRATSSLGKPYHLNPYSAAQVASARKGSASTVYYERRHPEISSLKRKFPMQSLLQAGLTVGIAMYLWVFSLYTKERRPKKGAATPLLGKYLIQNRAANGLMAGIDKVLTLLPKKSPPATPLNPKSFLISNLAHMGDVLFMTALLSVLKENFKEAHIGVVVGSWSLPIVKNHPYVDSVHVVDHWKLNRSRDSLFKKILHYYKTKKSALKKIKKWGYEVAMDAYPYFPNAIPFFWQAKIPIRMGYTSGGFGPLLTHACDFTRHNESIISSYRDLLKFLSVAETISLKPFLPRLAPHRLNHSKEYIVIHMGTGLPLKEWPLEKWRELVKTLSGHSLVFTGKGERERDNIHKVMHNADNCINLADQLSWEEYLSIVQGAKLLIGVDSLAGHLAAAFDIPSVLLYTGMTYLHHFAPLSPDSKIISHHVPCAPCYQSRGCASMKCIREISVKEVLAVVNSCL